MNVGNHRNAVISKTNAGRAAGRYVRTLRHLQYRQIAGRVVAPFRRAWAARAVSPLSVASPTGALSNRVCFPKYQPGAVLDAGTGTFSFLNRPRHLGRPVNWKPGASALWTFNLHYFEYLCELSRAEQKAFCREWVKANRIGREPAWHPYPTSRRIIHWCKADFADADLQRSLYQQAAFLAWTTETHLLGNHLLENARALLFAGCYFEGYGDAPDWKDQALEIYRAQTEEQILADGGHFERSPMYHALMLEGYVDAANLLPRHHPDQSLLRAAVRRMSDFLVSLTHPDGRLALFNDAAHHVAVPTEPLAAYVRRVTGYRPQQQRQFPQSGYYRIDHGDLSVLIDGGPIGPDYLPAHAHADIFSYELSLFGERFVVDSGVYQYAAGPMRDYVRSTAAHNTVQVDGLDQIECWDAFRVARRDAPRGVTWRETEAGAVFEGTYDGYQSRVGDDLSHHRRIEIDADARRVHVHDEVVGRGEHCAESRIHLHPEVHVRQEGNVVYLCRGENQCRIETAAGRLRREQGWYCPRFGVRHRVCAIVLRSTGKPPLRCDYQIQY